MNTPQLEGCWHRERRYRVAILGGVTYRFAQCKRCDSR